MEWKTDLIVNDIDKRVNFINYVVATQHSRGCLVVSHDCGIN